MGRDGGWDGWLTNHSQVSRVSGMEDGLSLCPDVWGLPIMDHGRGEQAEAGMTMLLVVPEEKLLAEGTAVL